MKSAHNINRESNYKLKPQDIPTLFDKLWRKIPSSPDWHKRAALCYSHNLQKEDTVVSLCEIEYFWLLGWICFSCTLGHDLRWNFPVERMANQKHCRIIPNGSARWYSAKLVKLQRQTGQTRCGETVPFCLPFPALDLCLVVQKSEEWCPCSAAVLLAFSISEWYWVVLSFKGSLFELVQSVKTKVLFVISKLPHKWFRSAI